MLVAHGLCHESQMSKDPVFGTYSPKRGGADGCWWGKIVKSGLPRPTKTAVGRVTLTNLELDIEALELTVLL
jgi:hypothetical protein